MENEITSTLNSLKNIVVNNIADENITCDQKATLADFVDKTCLRLKTNVVPKNRTILERILFWREPESSITVERTRISLLNLINCNYEE